LLAEIEKYHEASVVAHREHRVPDVHLPVIA
jgi:cell division protease FtsH